MNQEPLDFAAALSLLLAAREEIKRLRSSGPSHEDVATLLRGFQEGVFVRDITRDVEPGWAIKLMPYLAALGRLSRGATHSEGEAK